MKIGLNRNHFNFNNWKLIRESGFIKYVYKRNIFVILPTLIYFIFFSSRSWIEIIATELVLLIIVNLSSYFEWWENEERFDKELNNDKNSKSQKE